MIRLATVQDAGPVQAIYAPFVAHTAISFEQKVPSKQEMQLRINEVLLELPWLVYEQHGTILGYAYATKPSHPDLIQNIDTLRQTSVWHQALKMGESFLRIR